MKLPIITRRLYITRLDESMAESMHINSIDEDNRRFVPDEVFETVNDARAIIKTLISYYECDDKPLVYPIILNDGQNIGYVQAVPIFEGWEIGYHVARPFTGNGYATEALTAYLPPVMRRLGVDKIHGVCLAENAASRKVLEKCGFILAFDGPGPYQGKERHIRRYIWR